MPMDRFVYLALILTSSVYSFGPFPSSIVHVPATLPRGQTQLFSDKNSDMFGGSTPSPAVADDGRNSEETATSGSYFSNKNMKDQAATLRREAAELEIAMREEAREKGLPQEVIDKLIPMRSQTAAKPKTVEGSVLEASKTTVVSILPASEIREKLGYLNTGDAIRFTSELERLKSRGTIRLYGSKDVSKSTFAANAMQLTSKTGIEPVSLRLDAVGFEYQKVFVFALGFATVFGKKYENNYPKPK